MARARVDSAKAGTARTAAPVLADGFALALCITLIGVFWIDKFALADGRGFLSGDLFVYYYPTYAQFGALLRSGSSLLWDPHSLTGMPALASLQRGYAYPPHLVFALLPTSMAMAALTWIHLSLGAGGTFWFARRIGLATRGAAVAALLFGIGHHFPALTFFPNLLEAASWFPLGCALCVSLPERSSGGAVAGLAAVWALSLLAGYPQASLFTVYGWAGVLAILLAWRSRPPRVWLRSYARLALVGLVGSLLAAVQLVPTFELVREGVRSGGALSIARMFPFGVPDGLGEAFAQLAIHGAGTRLFLGFGLIAGCLAPFAFLGPARRRLAAGLLLLGATFGLLALGPATPAFELLRQLPGLSSFRLPNRGLFVTSFALALVAALAIETLQARLEARNAGGRRAWLLIPLWIAVVAEPFFAARSGLGLPYLHDDVLVYEEASRLAGTIEDRTARILIPDTFPQPVLPSKAASLHGLHSFSSYAPINTRRQSLYFDYLDRGRLDRSPDEAPFHGFVTGYAGWLQRRRLLDLAAVRYVVLPGPEGARHRRALLAAGFEPRSGVRLGGKVMSIWTNPSALPRAYVSERALPALAPAEMLARMSESDFDPRAGVYVEGAVAGDAASSRPAGEPMAPPRVRIVRDAPTAVEIEAEVGAPGVLVLSDAFYPGWTVTVDGARGRILPVNLLFRGVELSAGRHRVVFEYRPRSVWIGGSLSAVGFVALLALGWRERSAAR